jgi:hypothetical protein
MHRTIRAAPLLRDDAISGVIVVRRTRVEPFTDRQTSWSVILPTRRLSLSRTRACSTSCANRCSSRPPPPTCSKSSAARPSISRQCCRPLLNQSLHPRGGTGATPLWVPEPAAGQRLLGFDARTALVPPHSTEESPVLGQSRRFTSRRMAKHRQLLLHRRGTQRTRDQPQAQADAGASGRSRQQPFGIAGARRG